MEGRREQHALLHGHDAARGVARRDPSERGRGRPDLCTQGARMNTAWNGPPSIRSMSTSSSKESTWRPNALRRTVTSMPPIVSSSGEPPPSMRSASRIIPAHEP
jgi:hypothetical protein